MGGIIALGVFGGFILLAITVTLILIFVRRSRGPGASQRSLDTTTVTTYDSNGSGLHRFYKRAWDNLRYDGKATAEGFREASEITVNDAAALYARPDKGRDRSPPGDKKAIREWYSQQLGHHSRRGAF